jgi:hypothetical protein
MYVPRHGRPPACVVQTASLSHHPDRSPDVDQRPTCGRELAPSLPKHGQTHRVVKSLSFFIGAIHHATPDSILNGWKWGRHVAAGSARRLNRPFAGRRQNPRPPQKRHSVASSLAGCGERAGPTARDGRECVALEKTGGFPSGPAPPAARQPVRSWMTFYTGS